MSTLLEPMSHRCNSCKKADPVCGFPPKGLTCIDCNTKRKKRRAAGSQRKAAAKEETRVGKKKCGHGTWCNQDDFEPGQKCCENHREYNRNRTAKRRACDQALALPPELQHLSTEDASASSSEFTEVFSALSPLSNITLAAGEPSSDVTFASFDSAALQSAGEGLPDLPDITEADIDLLDGQVFVHEETPHGDGSIDNPVVDSGVGLADQFGQMQLGVDTPKGSENQTCDDCGTVGPGMMRCGRCQSVWYCTKACQRKSWKLHKKLCSAPDAAEGEAAQQQHKAEKPCPQWVPEVGSNCERLFNQGLQALGDGEHEIAAPLFDKVTGIAPQFGYAHCNAGLCR